MTFPIIDFNKLTLDQSKLIEEPEEVKLKREAFNKLIQEQGLEGFFGPVNAQRPPSSIGLEYDVQAVKEEIELARGGQQ